MASRSQVKDAEENEDFELPTGKTVEENTASLQDLEDFSLDHERDEEVKKLLSLPAGDYKKDGFWKVTERFYDDDAKSGDKYPGRGRYILSLSGRVEKGDHEGFLFFSLSPDLRMRKKREGDNPNTPNKPDNMTKLFIQAKTLYESIHQELPSKRSQIIEMLEEESYQLAAIQNDNGNFIVGLKPVRRR